MRWKRALLLGLGLVLLVGVGVVGFYAVPRWPAARTLLAFTEDVPPDGVPLAGFVRVRDAGRLGAGDVWIARPDAEGPQPLLIFLGGITPKGLDDGRVVRAVEAFRRGGFVVVAPFVRGLADPGAPDRGVETFARLLAALERGAVEGIEPTRWGVVAISVGAPYALRVLAAHVRDGGRRPDAFLAVGAPADFERCARPWFDTPTLGKEEPENQEEELRHAADLGRNMLWRTAVRALVGDDAEADRLNAWLTDAWMPERPPEGLTTDAGRDYAAMVLGPLEGWRARRDEVLAAAAPWTAWLSPAGFVDELEPLRGLRVFLLHGETDPLIPVSELEPLADLLSPTLQVRALRSRMITHIELADIGMGHRLEHVDFMDAFFDAVKE